VQIIFAATMIVVALGETLLSPAVPAIIDGQVPPCAANRYKRLGTVALVTGCILGPPVGGAILGADWETSLLATFAMACAVASIAGRQVRAVRLAPGPELRAGFQPPPLPSMPVEYLTPVIDDWAGEAFDAAGGPGPTSCSVSTGSDDRCGC
jgi:MFS family permease